MIRQEKLPPTNISPADLWAELTQTPRPHRIVEANIRGKTAEIAMVVLTQEESTIVSISVEKWVRKQLKDGMGEIPKAGELAEGYVRLFEQRSALEILHRVSKKPDDLNKPFFPSVEEIGRVLTTDEVGILFQEYSIIRAEIGPIIAYMSQQEMDAWVDRLVKGGSQYPLALLTSEAQMELVKYMACQLNTLRMDNTSLGTQPEEII